MTSGWTGLNWSERGVEAVEESRATFSTACGPYGAHAIRQRNPLVGLGCSQVGWKKYTIGKLRRCCRDVAGMRTRQSSARLTVLGVLWMLRSFLVRGDDRV